MLSPRLRKDFSMDLPQASDKIEADWKRQVPASRDELLRDEITMTHKDRQTGSSPNPTGSAAMGDGRHSASEDDITDAKTLPAGTAGDMSSEATLPAPSQDDPALTPNNLATEETLPSAVGPGRSQTSDTQHPLARGQRPKKVSRHNAGEAPPSDQADATSGTITAKDAAPPTEQDLTEVTPECPDRYTILWEAGRGGIGRVVLAEDRHTGRQIAIKELLIQKAADASTGSVTGATARFLREARITAQLEHPGIVPLYEIGKRRDGTFYYTMKFIRGKTLLDTISESPDVSDRLSLLPAFSNLCNAIAFAHSKGILHRDIKPGNVMLGQFGETLVIDWGLAKTAGGRDRDNSLFSRRAEALRDLAAGQTIMGQAVGTPAYMAPEQALGKHDDVDELSDVYALGAVLYQILTGRPPFTGKNAQEILLDVIEYAAGDKTLPVPTDIDPDVPPELSAVAMKALNADKRARYGSAKDLVRDVEAFMTGTRVIAYRYSKIELFTRFIRRHKAAATASMAVLVAILSALVVTSLSYRKEWAARQRERRARIMEHEQRLTAHWQLARAHLHKALTLAADHRLLEAGLFASKGLLEDPRLAGSPYHDPAFRPPETPDTDLMDPELASMIYLAKTSAISGVTKALALHDDPKSLVLSAPTGNLLISSDRGITALGMEPGHKILRPPRGIALALSPDGQSVVLRRIKGRLAVWSVASRQTIELSANGALVRAAAFLAPNRVALGFNDGSVEIWNVTSNERLWHKALFLDPVDHLAGSGGNVVAASSGRRIALFVPGAKTQDRHRTPLRQSIQPFETTTPAPVTALSLSPNGRWLAVGSDDGTILLRGLEKDALLRRLSAHRDRVTALRFSPRGDLLASGSWDGTMRLWSRTGQAIAAVSAHEQGVRDLTFSPNADLIVTVGSDRRALVWRLARPMPVTTFQSAVGQIKAAAFSPDGRFLAAGGSERAAAIWLRKAPDRPIAHLLGESAVRALAFSADAHTLFYAFDGRVVSVRCPAGSMLRSVRAHENVIRSMQSCPNGKLLLTAGMDGHLKGWDPSTGRSLFDIHTKHRILRSALSPDCREAATAAMDGRVQLWSLTNLHAPSRLLLRHAHLASALAYSPDGTTVASAGKDATIVVQDRASGHILARLTAHSRWVNQVVFSPNGKLLASGGDDRRVWIWDRATWHPLFFIPTQKEVSALTFSPDGKWLALGDAGRLLVYPMTIGDLTSHPAKTLDDLRRRMGQPAAPPDSSAR